MYEKLQQAGIVAEQAKVYVALLEHGQQTQSELARSTGINRTTLYPHISELLALGLISQTKIGKRTAYFAEHPEKVSGLLQKRSVALQLALPLLENMYNKNAHTPKTRVFLGVSGLRQIHHEIADTANYVKTFFAPESFLQVLTLEDDRYFREAMVRREVQLKGLCNDTRQNRAYMKERSADAELQTRYMPKDFNFSIEISMFNQKIVFFSWEHRFAVAIDSLEIKSYHEQLFDYFWKVAGK